MNDYQIDKIHLLSESDVEQKVIYPLLSNKEPIGLGFDNTEIQTKINLRKILIDKGSKSILYYPDYLININGVPLLIIEAKKPGEDLDEAFRQASLYAAELNRKFEKDTNPCQLIIASDGLELYAGYWDSLTPSYKIQTEHWNYTEQDFNNFLNKFSKSSLEKRASNFKDLIRRRVSYKRPLTLLGGRFVQDKPTENSFGETISIQYRHLFSPNIEEEKIDIVKNAYVQTSKHESHVGPIDKLIRKKVLPSSLESNEIDDNTNPQEIITLLQNAHNYNNQVLLLIGSVGSGKSTFSTYLKEIALSDEVVNKLTWITIDLNNAPVSSGEIYNWLKNDIIRQIQKEHSDTDFSTLSSIEKLYSSEISKLKNGVLKILNPESDKYKELLVERILSLQDNIDITLSSYIEQFVHALNKELIITIDNCDKRNLEEQLLMFEVANWLKDSVKAIVFLPLRDTTFDHFRKEKPLDTVVNDLIFRIYPPSLEKVLYSRVRYAARLSENMDRKDRFYHLSNNIKVNYPAQDELYYLKAILTSLFQNSFFKKLISGLAGSDIRIGLGIFLDFCKSGHISEKEIYKIRQSKGDIKLPNHIISKVFLRGKKVYYNDASSIIKNLFQSDPHDDLPDPFIRISILKWLYEKNKIKGPSGIIGFHLAETMLNELISMGHDKTRLQSEIQYLAKQTLIISESQKQENIDYKELISINTSGIVHLDLITNIDYLSACAEDTWYNIVETATRISKNMAGDGRYLHLSLHNSLDNAKLLFEYLNEYYDKYFSNYSEFVSTETFFAPVDFKHLSTYINIKNSLSTSKTKKYSKNSLLSGEITRIGRNGFTVGLLNSHESGFVHINQFKSSDALGDFQILDKVKVKVIRYNEKFKKYELEYISYDESDE